MKKQTKIDNCRENLMGIQDVLTHVSSSLDYLEDHCPETRMSSLLVMIHSEVEKSLGMLKETGAELAEAMGTSQ